MSDRQKSWLGRGPTMHTLAIWALVLGLVALLTETLEPLFGTSAQTVADLGDFVGPWLLWSSALLFSFVAVRNVAAARTYEDESDAAFVHALGGLWLTFLVGLLAAINSSDIFEQLNDPRVDWFSNNFELLLIGAGIALVVFADWTARQWVDCAQEDKERDLREFQINFYSISFASAVGVLVLVMIGSSVFTARLAQMQIETPVSGSAALSMARAQETARRLRLIEQEQDIALSERDRIIRSMADVNQRYQAVLNDRFRALSPAYDAVSEVRRALGETVEYTPEPTAQTIESLRVRVPIIADPGLQASAMRNLATAESALEAAEAFESQVQDVRAGMQPFEASLQDSEGRLRRLLEQRNCVLARVVLFTRSTSATSPPASDQTLLPPGPADCPGVTSVTNTELIAAERLIDAVMPLSRSWMSDQLARRASIALSLELVVIMGALGALLRVASTLLVQLIQPLRTQDQNNQSLVQRAYDMAQGNEATLHTLALQTVFGMATALAFFVLLNVTINAASLQISGRPQSAESLNPFTMAALGLLGGYAALNVAVWMGEMATHLLDQLRRRTRGQTCPCAGQAQSGGGEAPSASAGGTGPAAT